MGLGQRIREGKADFASRLARSRPSFGGRRNHPLHTGVVLIPHDLRTSDYSFWSELRDGYLSLGGATVALGDQSPFHVDVPSDAFKRALHGFEWLNDIPLSMIDDASPVLHTWLEDWFATCGSDKNDAVIWDADVTAGRLMAWIRHSELLLTNIARDLHGSLIEAVNDHTQFLEGVASGAKNPPTCRAAASVALITAALCLESEDNSAQIETALAQWKEIAALVLGDDGMPLSRESTYAAALLLDLLPLRQCFRARDVERPEWFDRQIENLQRALRAVRHDKGEVSRFNGVGIGSPDVLAALSPHDVAMEPLPSILEIGDYVRVKASDILLLIDGGGACPVPALSTRAHAGSLSLELSVAGCPFFMNCGRPAFGDQDEVMRCRGTAAHNTLVIEQRSSAQLIAPKSALAENRDPALSGPRTVQRNIRQRIHAEEIALSHDGYLESYGLLHNRALKVARDGTLVEAEDSLRSGKAGTTGAAVAFAVHFHLHPSVAVSRSARDDVVVCRLSDGSRWQFTSERSAVSIETTQVHLAALEPSASTQIVLRGRYPDVESIGWRLEKVDIG